MIIGIDASRANVQQKSGTELVAFCLIQEFKKIADPHDQFVLYSKEPLSGPLADLPPNFTSRVLKWPPRFVWTQLRLAWEMLIRPPDVLFVPAHTIPIIHPKRTYTVLHDIGFEYYRDLYSSKKIGPAQPVGRIILSALVRVLTLGRYGANEIDYHRWSARFAIHHAKKIITVSEFSRQEMLRRYHADPEKIVTLPNAFNTDYHRIDDQAAINAVLKTYNIKQPFLLFIGRLETKKNTPNLVKAFSLLKKNYRYPGSLVLIGKPGFGFDEVKRTMTDNGMGDSVVMPGWVDTDALPKIMNAADAFVFPSNYEGFGMPILEAMNCGVPVITSLGGATAEVAGQAAMLVDPKDIHDIARGINTVVTHPAMKNRLIALGFRRASEFSWGNAASHYLKIFSEI